MIELARKLGLVPGARAYVRGAPESLTALFAELALVKRATPPLSYIHLFATEEAEVARFAPRLAACLEDRGIFWVSWPKKAAKVPTTLDDGVVRRIGLSTGLVDVKVCAIDEVWSGLKLVRRVTDRR